jgi:hypothetical protein
MNGLGDMDREHTERAMMALRALQSAISGLQLIEDNAISISEFRDLFPAIWDDLNKAEHYLSTLNDLSTPRPIYLHN